MQVLHVCSEMFPLLKTGGLADVIGALPAAQIADGVDARVLLPAFPDIRRGVTDAQVVSRRDTFAGHITLLFGHYNGVGIYLIDAPHLYDRPGSPYPIPTYLPIPTTYCVLRCWGGLGQKWPAGLTHSGVLMWVCARLACRPCACVFGGARASGEVGVYRAQPGLSRHVLCTSSMNDIQLPWSFFNIHGLEFKRTNLFPEGRSAIMPITLRQSAQPLRSRDHRTAVCLRYGRSGCNSVTVKGVFRRTERRGREIWSPETDLLLASRYTRDTLEDKAENKRQLQIAMGLKVDDKVPLFAVVSRLTSQKGLDLVLEALPGLLEQGGQLALLGAGDPVLQEGFLAVAAEWPRPGGAFTDWLSRSIFASH